MRGWWGDTALANKTSPMHGPVTPDLSPADRLSRLAEVRSARPHAGVHFDLPLRGARPGGLATRSVDRSPGAFQEIPIRPGIATLEGQGSTVANQGSEPGTDCPYQETTNQGATRHGSRRGRTFGVRAQIRAAQP